MSKEEKQLKEAFGDPLNVEAHEKLVMILDTIDDAHDSLRKALKEFKLLNMKKLANIGYDIGGYETSIPKNFEAAISALGKVSQEVMELGQSGMDYTDEDPEFGDNAGSDSLGEEKKIKKVKDLVKV